MEDVVHVGRPDLAVCPAEHLFNREGAELRGGESLERPAEAGRVMPAPAAPPGAPIGGDPGWDWLAPVPLCTWSGARSDWWTTADWLMM